MIYFVSANVSLAIASSSFVGINITHTFESGVEITVSSPRLELAASSNLTPRYPRYSQTSFLTSPQFSQTPAVNAIPSTPFIAAV